VTGIFRRKALGKFSASTENEPYIDGNPILLKRLYEEVLSLTVEARNYFSFMPDYSKEGPREFTRFLVIQEEIRVTVRLTQALAWLMTRQAVQKGEIQPSEAFSLERRLSCQELCLDTQPSSNEILPVGLSSLLERSFRIYERIGRLEQVLLSAVSDRFSIY